MIRLIPGTYRIDVTDSTGTTAQGQFTAVAHGPRRQDGDLASLDVPTQRLIAAVKLASSQPQWRFEAYQQLAEASVDDFQSMVVRDLLALAIPLR